MSSTDDFANRATKGGHSGEYRMLVAQRGNAGPYDGKFTDDFANCAMNGESPDQLGVFGGKAMRPLRSMTAEVRSLEKSKTGILAVCAPIIRVWHLERPWILGCSDV